MEKKLVSIITPCYNGQNFIGRFLDSVLNQTYQNIELIIVNDGSTDFTENIIKAYTPKFKKQGIELTYRYQENAGQAAALNNGLKLFKGEYMTWVDSDDELMPDYIKAKVEYMEEHPECAYCYGKMIFVNDENPSIITNIFEGRKKKGRYSFFEDLIYVRNIVYSGYIVRANCLDLVVKNRDIFSGSGGQNAQLLLPLSWRFGEPEYADASVYKCYIRKDSHSHSQNTVEKYIQQLCYYEKILIETIKRIDDEKASNYIDSIKKHYSRLRFGNSIGTKDSELIKKSYKELKGTKQATLKDYFLYLKYTNSLARFVFRV